MVHPGAMTIAPFHVDSIPTDGLDLGGTNAWVQGFFFKGPFAGHLIDTGGAGAMKPKLQVGKGEGFTRIKPKKNF